MSNAFYDRSAKTVKRMLNKYGQPATLARTDGDGNVTEFTTQIVIVATVRHALGDSGVMIGDHHLLMIPDVEPKQGDEITYVGADAGRVVVEPLIPIQPGAVVVGYEVFARQG